MSIKVKRDDCIKCGASNPNVLYQPGFAFGTYQTKEHLKLICRFCSYSWITDCFDAKKGQT